MPDAEHNGAVLVKGEPKGAKMGWMKIDARPPGACCRRTPRTSSRARKPSVVVLQTCKGDLSIERWAEICQTPDLKRP